MLEGKWGAEGSTAKGFEEFVETVGPEAETMLYFVGILRREAGTEGESEISRRLCTG